MKTERAYRTTFGSVPIGKAFDCWIRETDPNDRRRKRTRLGTFIKATHGTIAGFATNDRRFDHWQPVFIDATDLRLLFTVVQNDQSQCRFHLLK